MKNLAYYNGKISLIEEMMIPMNDRVCWFGDGVYDVAMCRNYKPYRLQAHIDRFFRSAELLRMSVPMTKDELAELLLKLVRKVDDPDQMIYFQLTRGTAERLHSFSADMKPNLWITLKPAELKPLDKVLTLLSVEDTRYLHCNIKTLNLIPNCMAEQAAIDAGYNTAVFHRGNIVTECAHSNVHIINDGKIITHEADNLILPGIARSNLLRISEKIGIPVEIREFTTDELMNADEVFTTSTTAICQRVKAVDGTAVGFKDEAVFKKLQTALYSDYLSETD